MKFRPSEDFSSFYGEKPENKEKAPKNQAISKRDIVFKRDAYKCVKCKTSKNLTLDHIVPWSISKDNSIKNLQTMCGECNHEKGDRLMLKNGSYVLATPENIKYYKGKLF